MASIETLEWVLRELWAYTDDLQACTTGLEAYRGGIDLAIEAPATRPFEDEATRWITRLQAAESAVAYWIRDISWEIDVREAAEEVDP